MMPSTAIVAHVPSPAGKEEKVAGGRKLGCLGVSVMNNRPPNFYFPLFLTLPPKKICEIGKLIAGRAGTIARQCTASFRTA